MYRNSFKLIFSNFGLVWKLLCYFLIILLVTGGISYAVASPIFNEIGLSEVLAKFPASFEEFIRSLDAKSFLVQIDNITTEGVDLIVGNFTNIWYLLGILAVVSVIIPSMLNNFYLMSTCNVLHYYMGSCTKFGFTASVFVNFWKNVRYQLACLVTILPLKLLTYYAVIRSFGILASSSLVIKILAPFIIMAIYVILTALRVSLFAGWVPFMVVKNANVWSSLVQGFKCIRKRFVQVFANSLGVVLTIILISVLGLLTFGVSLVITAPAAFLFIATFGMVVFYTCTGLRFYVDNGNVYAPKKAEMVESYKIYKNVI